MTPAAGHTPTAPRRPRPEPGRAGTLVLSGGGWGDVVCGVTLTAQGHWSSVGGGVVCGVALTARRLS